MIDHHELIAIASRNVYGGATQPMINHYELIAMASCDLTGLLRQWKRCWVSASDGALAVYRLGTCARATYATVRNAIRGRKSSRVRLLQRYTLVRVACAPFLMYRYRYKAVATCEGGGGECGIE